MSRPRPTTVYTAEDAKRELALRAKAELDKRRSTSGFKAAVIAALRGELFTHQLAVMDDPSPRLSLCCSRRAGKSELAARMIAIALLKSGHNTYVLFAARTLQRARQIIWPLLEKINDDYGLGWRMSSHVGQITTEDGAVFTLLGVDDAVSVEKVRGSKYALAVCDEASTYEALLERLVIDCIEPGTIDLSPRGKIVLTGTPGYALSGYWHSIATGKKPGWKSYYWTLRDNPHVPDVEAALASIREGNGWSVDDPTYRREYLGVWIADESSLVFAVSEGRNTCTLADLPACPAGWTWDRWIREEWSCTLGADIGYTDDFAISVIGSPPGSRDMYVLEAASQGQLRAEEQAAYIQRFREKYRPERTVIDVGGAGKLVHQEFNARYGHTMGGAAMPAQKMGKNEAIGLMNSDLRIGRLKAVLPSAVGLYREWCELAWADDERTKVNKHQKNHLCFVAGTLVETARGPVAIEDVVPGDMVVTRFGLRRVSDSGLTGVRETYTLASDAGTLTGTFDHPVLVAGGWKQLGDILPGEELLLWKQNTGPLSTCGTRARNIDGTPAPTTVQAACTGTAPSAVAAFTICTERSGSPCTAPYRPGTTYTISTRTLSTTPRRTWLASPQESTSPSTTPTNGRPSVWRPWSAGGLLQRLGTALRQGWSTIARTAKRPGPTESPSPSPAGAAAPGSCLAPARLPCAPTSATPNFAGSPGSTTRPGRASFAEPTTAPAGSASSSFVPGRASLVTPTGRVEPVYNLTVEGDPEYVANGVLVHNCDSALYAWRSHRAYLNKLLPDALSPAEAEAQAEREGTERRMKAAKRPKF